MRRLLALGAGMPGLRHRLQRRPAHDLRPGRGQRPAGSRSRVHPQGDARGAPAGVGRVPAADRRQLEQDEGGRQRHLADREQLVRRSGQPGATSHHPARRTAAVTRPAPRRRWGAAAAPERLQLGPARAACSRPARSPPRPMPTTADAQQDLALRVATRYFDVLAAQDNVQAQQASLDAISRQLEQADKRFEVGLIAITDVQEARAARDTAAADLIAAKRSARHLAGVAARDHGHAVRRARHAARHDAARRCPNPPTRRSGSRRRWSRTSR